MAKLTNPIVRGFAPDPSVCRVGADFYLVNSTFAYFPGVPIYHSTNLSDWTRIGHCLTRDSQLNLHECPFACGIYAPTLRHHKGRFTMITTNVARGGNFLVTADSIRGPWSEPVWIEVDSIDPSLFWDDDGTCYLSVNGSSIRQAKIDPESGKLLSELVPVWEGTGGKYPEGPHLFKRGEYYYLLIAEGGTEYGHMITIARSKSPMGPFESCPSNPICTHRSKEHPFQSIGHADLFDDADGNWWMVCLGVRPHGYPYTHCMGRETLLAPVRWSEDGWPIVGDDGMIPVELDLPASQRATGVIDGFAAETISNDWSFIRNPDLSKYRLLEPGIELVGSKHDLGSAGSPTWIGKPHGEFRQSFEVDGAAELTNGAEAGLSVFMNQSHRAELFFSGSDLILRVTLGKIQTVIKSVSVSSSAGSLLVKAVPGEYRFSATVDGKSIEMGTVETRFLSTEVASGFTGVMFAAYCVDPAEASVYRISAITTTYGETEMVP